MHFKGKVVSHFHLFSESETCEIGKAGRFVASDSARFSTARVPPPGTRGRVKIAYGSNFRVV